MTLKTGSVSSPSWAPDIRYNKPVYLLGNDTALLLQCDYPNSVSLCHFLVHFSGYSSDQPSSNYRWCFQPCKARPCLVIYVIIFFTKYCVSDIEWEGWVIVSQFQFFRARIVSTTLALRTTKFLEKEVEYMPWQTARRNLDYFFLMFDRSEVYGPMQVCDEWLFIG